MTPESKKISGQYLSTKINAIFSEFEEKIAKTRQNAKVCMLNTLHLNYLTCIYLNFYFK